jgi:pilus assembly protein CpaE
MRALIASDDQNVATRLRNILLAEGAECPLRWMVSVDSAIEVASADPKPHVVLLVMPQDLERSLVVLQELRRTTNARIVAIGAARDPRQILRVVHSGPDDYLDAEGDLEREVAEFLKRYGSGPGQSNGQGRIIAMMSPSGGSGCSFLAANLSVALAKTHGRSMLCDMDLRRGDLVSYLNTKPRHTINDLCKGIQRLDQGMFEQSLSPHESGVHLLAAPQSFSEVQPITADAAERIMKLARATFPFVVVDLEDFYHREQLQVLQMCDVALFVIRLDFTSLRNARRTFDYLHEQGVDPAKMQIVVNMYGRSKELRVNEAEDALGQKFSYYVPHDEKTALLSLNRGTPAVMCAPKAKLSYAIGEIAEGVSGGVEAAVGAGK